MSAGPVHIVSNVLFKKQGDMIYTMLQRNVRRALGLQSGKYA